MSADAQYLTRARFEELERRLAEAERELAEREWQPIETAPKDGSLILGFATVRQSPLVLRWEQSEDNWLTTVAPFTSFNVSRWMPLPAPPVQS